jgi:hypothetical protein
MKLIVGLPFDCEDYTIEYLDNLTDGEKYLYAMSTPDADSFETTQAFLYALNGGFVDTENLVWYEIEIL